MSRIILARLHSSTDHRVHSFDAHQHGDGTRTALCGFTAHHSALEPLPHITGMGCELCILATPLDEQPTTETTPPDDDPTSATVYAVGLRGELRWHDVPEHPLIHHHAGREVVLAECGSIGFLVFGIPPERYERCPDCPSPG
ncbi:hypothetical protein IQ251_16200 [Saccharopolyspora sp. HNM0983]|uniref:Uncharacterized protein n=1 Tax=Saccharopolyspora montiporae TaxID=2781240 RepID=A0A929B9Z1_9PSEU|nr:hypothetical protein [Saccharopolyspora sp. HNM0983]MBE9375994.1 hypothetical protein [Saccharopolyspora sp. HNM0983]